MKDIISRINQTPGNAIDIIQRTAVRIGEERAAEAAASMAYYGFFSMFPLLLVIVAVVSSVLENTTTQEQVLDLILQAFPFASDLIEENINQVLNARGSVGLIGLLGLAWSAMGVFTVLTRNINRAWPNTKMRNFFKMRLVALAIMTILIVGLVSLFIFNTIMTFLPRDINDFAENVASLQAFPDILMGLLLFTTLFIFYWWLPLTKVRLQEAAWGAIIGSIGISIITRVFTWYLGSGLSSYNLVYGSLGAIVALLFWIYLLSLIIFVGAHLSAAIAFVERDQEVLD